MKFKKNISLDITYSILFAIVLQVENPDLVKSNVELIFIFKNLILGAILVLWLRALSRNTNGALLVIDKSPNGNHPVSSGFKLIKQFLEIKVCCYVLIFCVYSIYAHTFVLTNIHHYLIQIFTVGFYTLSVMLISVAYFKVSVNHWLFVVFTLVPYLLLFTIHGMLDLSNYVIFSVLPSMTPLIMLGKLGSVSSFVISGLALTTFSTMTIFFFKSISKITQGPKYYNLMHERMN